MIRNIYKSLKEGNRTVVKCWDQSNNGKFGKLVWVI